MFVTTDAKGNLKMFPLRTRAKRHDDEVGSSANANPQPPQPHLPLLQVEGSSPPHGSRRRSRWSLVGFFHTPIPVIRSLALPRSRLRGHGAYPSRAACANCANSSSGIHPSAPTRNTKFPAHRPTPAFAFGLFSPGSRACSLSHLAGWVNHRTPSPATLHLQPPRRLERRVNGHGVGIRRTAAQRASCTHPAAPGAELCLWNGHTQSD